MGARHIFRPVRARGVAVPFASAARVAAPLAALALAASPLPVRAQGPQTPPPASSTQDPPPQDPPPAEAADKPPAKDPGPVTQEITAPPSQPQAELVAPPNNVSQSAGLGSAVATADPEGRRAKAELEGTALAGKPIEGVPDRLPPLQRGGWWCVFGAFAFASVGGVFAGLAEAEEDRATRLVSQIDIDTGGALQYSDVRAEYDDILARGRRDAVLAQGFIGAGAVVLAAGIGLFVADRVKRRPARVSAGLGGLRVRF